MRAFVQKRLSDCAAYALRSPCHDTGPSCNTRHVALVGYVWKSAKKTRGSLGRPAPPGMDQNTGLVNSSMLSWVIFGVSK